jgi:hypothetical protein
MQAVIIPPEGNKDATLLALAGHGLSLRRDKGILKPFF